MQDEVRNGVLLIDEAGLLSSPQLKRVVELAQQNNCRVILSGDTAQHTAVERGDALRLLERHAALQSVEIKKIRRQLDPTYREAVNALRHGNVEAGFAGLDKLGAVRKSPPMSVTSCSPPIFAGRPRWQVRARRFAHSRGRRARDGKNSCGIEKPQKTWRDGAEFVQLKNLRWTEAQRGDGKTISRGWSSSSIKIRPGSSGARKFWLQARKKIKSPCNEPTVRSPFDRAARGSWPCASAFVNVYEAGKLPLAPGEQIRITQNGQSKEGHRVNNGELRGVTKFTKEGDIVLDNGWVLDKNFGNLAHGYCVTSHSSQGKTIQRLFVAESEASLPAASREQFYVSASRGVEAIKIYTDNKDALMEAVAVSGERPAATDLAKGTLPEVLKARSLSRHAAHSAHSPSTSRESAPEEKRFGKSQCKQLRKSHRKK